MKYIWSFNKYKILVKREMVRACNTNMWNSFMLFKRCVKRLTGARWWLSGPLLNHLSGPHPWTIRVAYKPLVWHWQFFFSFSSFLTLIFTPKPLDFQSNPSICFFFRFDPYSFDYYLFYLKWLIKLKKKLILSSNFFSCQIWSSLFYCYLLCFKSFS